MFLRYSNTITITLKYYLQYIQLKTNLIPALNSSATHYIPMSLRYNSKQANLLRDCPT